ncbi:HsdR family type I site-specific deoxyribonuclease [Pseudomonas sp. PA-6-1D]|uniref:type I restriction endonuclease subunit R n=1 Tax=Pseudomonas TaxID=286 RepID=UPI001EEF9BC5|nr:MULTISPECIES: type I restriction endonuclease subunit R [Pseudomonas]MCF5144398.1 HsdR family type I site-specific deoxyribonuclease [Pseudomonas sp. PA-6-3C]MCF5148720.1 HsdR family type I site-specific deoxyribonuclease [Pseudomonas sp. PA-6-3F]MCF5160416.1 HsdR family type I site-specific deoxyribonuclease [Pseudomonas sp. PA-6-2E]MCF5176692.1 HsdR family type I site-specific deoxyribonuclease [Pseudomonas sp. PA-6-1D]MCF5194269.1 HsdR family type I site-specific deoxyribonuclease [Pseud
MTPRISEVSIEDAAVAQFAIANIGLQRAEALSNSIRVTAYKLNPQIPSEAIDTVLALLAHPPYSTLVENNRWLHDLLINGVPIEYKDAATGETRGGRARMIDFDNPANNDFLLARQLTVSGVNGKTIRLDLALYVNGLPLVLIELKDPANTAATLDVAIDQLVRYRTVAPDLFVPNLLLIVSDGLLTRVGSITSGRQRFTPWRPVDGGMPTLEALIRELLSPAALLDYLQSCVAFEEDERGNIVKKVAGYHQFRAVRKARASVIGAIKTQDRNDDKEVGKGGVVWHTQGSGKSLTMLMLAGTLVRATEMANPTVVIVTDRNDLDDQLFNTFAMGRALLRQAPVQADSREHLQQLLDRASGGVVFTTIHKFTEAHGTISERANVVVMADEAHRSQYGFVEGGARWMRKALPNATFVGFTGTPLTTGDKVTRHVFGEYTDVYDIRQAVADGATVPIYFESRIVKLSIDEAGVQEAEAQIAQYATCDENGQEAPESVRIPLHELYGASERLERVANFVVEHWEQRRAAMEGKAMLVTMSRDIASRLYDEICKLRPSWHDDDDAKGVVKVIMTGGPDDPAHLARHARSKAQRKSLADRFKGPADDFRLAIVVDMWLTGFDVPSAHTMYLDKPLAGHNLMQAIARVNRVYGEKPGGLIVDLIGLADPLADALSTYASATGDTDKPVKELQDDAIPAMQSAFEQLCSFFHEFNYEAALETDPSNALRVYLGAINHILDVKHNAGDETGWQRFGGMVKQLATAFALAVPREETQNIATHLAFFQRVAAMIRKRLADERETTEGRSDGSSDIDAAVRQVIGGAVDAGEVIDLFAAAGLDAARLDILSDDFLERVSALEQKNLALETLRKLLADQIKLSERSNLVQAQKFREALERAMLSYTNKQITTAQMIMQLLELAKWVREAKRHGQDLGLSDEEAAFYDALTENGSAKEAMKSDKLRLMARELAEMVRKMPRLDWTQRESVRADLRRKVRRLLAMYGYPPDLSEKATQLVLRQAELSTANS